MRNLLNKEMLWTARSLLWIAGVVWLAMFSVKASGHDSKIFLGEIADSQCALNVHSLSQSHKEMIAMKPEIKSDAECARYCVKERGGKFVLQTKDKVYKLDAQVLAEQWAGLKVKVVGTLDAKTGLITVESIASQAASPGNGPRPN